MKPYRMLRASFRARNAMQMAMAGAVLCALASCGGAPQAELEAGSGAVQAAVTGLPAVLTQRYDNGRTGLNASETVLEPSTVSASTFGKLFSLTVDGAVFAQPLYVPGLTIQGASHNVLFVATERDLVYAFDADTGASLWTASMTSTAHGAAPGATWVTSADISTSSVTCADLGPDVGITGTPVIDASTGTLYLVAMTKENGGFVQRLHALDITTGSQKMAPAQIAATIAGTGDGSNGGSLTFDPLRHSQRAGLLLARGAVHITWASFCDIQPYTGWFMSYNASTLAQTGVWNAAPDGAMGGVWMSGSGIAEDGSGNAFMAVGNGDYDGTRNFGDSIVRLDLTSLSPDDKGTARGNCALGVSGCPLTSSFTPFDQAALEAADYDLGSGGVLLLPGEQAGNHPHLLIEASKAGSVYVLDRDDLGGHNQNSNSQIVQYLPGVFQRYFGTPAYWHGNVYFVALNDVIKAYGLTAASGTTLLTAAPTSSGSTTYGFPGASPVVSANSDTHAIVWALQTSGARTGSPAVLHAYDATNVAVELYSSATNAARDTAGPAVKFAVPTVVNGKVYVGAVGQVNVYGPLTTPGFRSNYATMNVRGTMNGWGTTPMALVADHTWQVAITLSATRYQYKFDVANDWATNWGDTAPVDGVGDPGGGNISLAAATAGSYLFQFNDGDLHFTVTPPTGTPAVPLAPAGLNVSAVSSSQIGLTWTASAGATSYAVYRGNAAGGPFGTKFTLGNVTSFADTGLSASTTYYYQVTASNAAGESLPSGVGSATTLPPSTGFQSNYATMNVRGTMNAWGATPMALVADHVWQVAITLGVNPGCQYKFDAAGNWANDWGDTAPVDGVGDPGGSNINLNAATAGSYLFQFNDSDLHFTVAPPTGTPAVPPAPTGLNASGLSSSQIGLTWNASSGATSYTILRGNASAGPFDTALGPVTTTSFTDAGLSAGTTYYYEVKANNAVGASLVSNVASGSTLSAAPFASNYPTMFVRGTMNAWGAKSMTLVADHTWQATLPLSASTGYQYKLDVANDWATNWGDTAPADGVGDSGGSNISFTTGAATSYVFTFHDDSKTYAVVAGP
jgi:hypothetical protein